jgi:tetratricopeptide (TPR) repeat protein
MADKDVSKPAEPPKPVQIGGESLLDRILPHIKKVIIGVVVIAVVISGFLGLRACQEGKKERETKRLATVMEIAKQPVASPGAPADPKNPGFADEKTRAQRVLDEMLKQDTDLAGPAYRAGLLVDADKIDEAIAEYKKCTSGSNTSIDVVLCREGLAIAIETKAAAEKDAAARQKGLEDALAAFVSMQPAEDGPRRAYALYHQARLQLQLGKRNEAKSLFEKAKELTPPKELVDQIERRLANLGVS